MKKTYGEAIKELEVLVVERPAKGLGQEEAGQEIVKPTEAQSEEVATPQTEEAVPAASPAATEE